MCKKHLNGKCCQSDGEFFGLCDMLESRGLLLLRKKKQVRLSTVSVALCILAIRLYNVGCAVANTFNKSVTQILAMHTHIHNTSHVFLYR